MSYQKTFFPVTSTLLLPFENLHKMKIMHIDIKMHGDLRNKGIAFLAMKEAYKTGICGIAKYHPDSLQISAEGNEKQLERFTAWCRKAISGMTGDQVDVSYGAIVGYKDFEIKSNNN